MADRGAKRLRRLSTDYDDSEGADDWGRDKGSSSALSSAAPTASSTRPRRNTANQAPPAAVIQRSSPEETRQSIHLTVKASPGKLRKATSGNIRKAAVTSRNIVVGKRASRSSRVIREVDSDEDEEEDEEPEEVDAMDVDDEEDEEEDAEGDEDEDVDAEGEEDDDMELTPAPRIVVSTNKTVPVKPKAAQDSVEAKEMAMDDDDDEELSELESDAEGEEEDAEGEDEDAEGEEDDELGAQNDEEDEDEEMDSSDEMSRDQTPDLSKLTRRQQAMIVQGGDGELMALSNEAQKKKHLTAEEHAMRRAEMARRRKNLSEKRNEEEKMDTINRLLKKQPPKRGRRVIQDITESGQEDELDYEKANPLYVRYRQTAKGTQLAVPEEWLQAPIGSLFTGPLAKPSRRPFNGRMVEEVA